MAASGILDLRSHFGLERQPQVEPEEEEEEPVHPLDLRICKVNESISRNNHASNNVFNDALQARHQESEAENHRHREQEARASNTTSVSPPVPVPTTIDSLRLRSPMQSAFPGQIPPDRRYSEASSPQGHHHYENPMLTLRPLNELQAKVQQHIAQQQHRYHPYGDYKNIRNGSGNDHQRQGSGNEHRPSKSAFLRHVLQHRDVSSHHQNHYHQKVAGQSFGTNNSGSGMKSEPVDHAMEIDRRMEALDQRLRLHDHQNSVKNSGYYSPPESPVTGNNPCLPPPLCFDPELAVRRHRDFLRKLHEGHFFGNAAAAAAAAAAAGNYFGPQSPLSPPDEGEYAGNRSPPPLEPLSPLGCESLEGVSQKGKRGRPRKHAIKIPLPPLYVFIRNLLHNRYYNPRVVSWVCEYQGIFKVNNTVEFARTWGRMKANRSEEMTYEKMSRAMRYHYGSEKQGRKGHLAMVKEKRLVYRFGELAVNWRSEDVMPIRPCQIHDLCRGSMCLWHKEK